MEKKRGRPRSVEAERAILQSAYELLLDKGLARLTVEAVAQRAGVGKPTIYRYWANAQELAMAALLAQPIPETLPQPTDAPLEDLRRQLAQVVRVFSSAPGRQITQMMAASESDSELAKAFRNQIILKCRTEGRDLLDRAVASGAVSPKLDVELVLDLIYGAIFYRLLTGRHGLDAAFAEAIIDQLLSGMAPS